MRQMRKDPSEKCLVEAFYETNEEGSKREILVEAFYETNEEETEREMSRRSFL